MSRKLNDIMDDVLDMVASGDMDLHKLELAFNEYGDQRYSAGVKAGMRKKPHDNYNNVVKALEIALGILVEEGNHPKVVEMIGQALRQK